MCPTLVMLHHFGGSARSWDMVIERIGDAFPTLALDLPGFGDAAAAAGPYTIDACADFVEAEMRARGLAQTTLVGHSMGGKVALALAARRPPGLRSLVLLAPSPPTPEPIEDFVHAALLAGWATYSSASRMLASITARALPDDARKRAVDDLMRCGKAAWSAWLYAGSREDISAAMPQIHVSTTLLSGTRDTVFSTDVIRREVAARLRISRLQTVPGAGHLLPLEAPDAVAAAIARAASDLPKQRRTAIRIGTNLAYQAPTTPQPSAIQTGLLRLAVLNSRV